MGKKPEIVSTQYTREQVEEVLRLRTLGMTYSAIAAAVSKKFRLKKPFTENAAKSVFVLNEALVADMEIRHPYSDFTRDSLTRVARNRAKNARFFVTAASPVSPYSRPTKVDGVPVYSNLFHAGWESVLRFCAFANAEPVILPMPAHVRALAQQPAYYDPELLPYRKYFSTEHVFSPTLRALELFLNPQQFNPLTSLRRIRPRDRAVADMVTEKARGRGLIVGHTRQELEMVATGISTPPYPIHSTGAITLPEYRANRVGRISTAEHTLGGLFIEVSGTHYFIRQVQIDPKSGEFVSFVPHRGGAFRFYPDRAPTRERVEEMKLGDIHPGFTDPKNLDAKAEVMKMVAPRRVSFGDWFDGASISHWLEEQVLSRQALPPCFDSLRSELDVMWRVLTRLRKMAPTDAKLFATPSNHPEWLTKYLSRKKFARDDVNLREAVRLLHQYFETHPESPDVDDEGVHFPEARDFLTADMPEGIILPRRNEDRLVEGVQMNAHGDMPFGSGPVMKEHDHVPSIRGDVWTVGMSTVRRQGYNNGASRGVQCDGFVFRGGGRQLIVYVDGAFHFPDGGK